MKLTTLTHEKNSGWSRPFPTDDSEQTLVIVFGSLSFYDQPSPIKALADAFPHSHLAGCSTAADGQPQPDRVTAVGLYGSRVRVGHGSKGGWDIFGPERLVTRSEGHILYELDGRPALQLYKEYLGDMADGLPAAGLLFPLALRASHNDPKQIVRTILGVDEANNALIFAGDISQGCRAQFMKANFDRLVDSVHQAALITRQNNPADAKSLCLAVSCVGRRLVLGERTEQELEATLDALPENTRQIGFCSDGEISPFGIGHCDLHNQTMTLTTIVEV